MLPCPMDVCVRWRLRNLGNHVWSLFSNYGIFCINMPLFALSCKLVSIILHKNQVKHNSFPFTSLRSFPYDGARIFSTKVWAVSNGVEPYHTVMCSVIRDCLSHAPYNCSVKLLST